MKFTGRRQTRRAVCAEQRMNTQEDRHVSDPRSFSPHSRCAKFRLAMPAVLDRVRTPAALHAI